MNCCVWCIVFFHAITLGGSFIPYACYLFIYSFLNDEQDFLFIIDVFDDSSALEWFTSRKREQFIKCKKSGSCFFTKARNINDCLTIIDKKLLAEYKILQIVHCDHLMPVTPRVSRSEKNPGRPYFSCGKKE